MILTRNLYLVVFLTLGLAVSATLYGLSQDLLIRYGDAESHLNISKRVTHSLTPGLAQLGGIWLPLPHLLMIPFTAIDTLWQTGIAGAVVSGFSYIVASVFMFAIIYHMTKNLIASWLGTFVFALNPNILYLQTTAMTEIPLVAFFLGSIYFYMKHLETGSLKTLVLSAAIGLAATLSRYDGWFLVLAQTFILIMWYLFISTPDKQKTLSRITDKIKSNWHRMESNVIIFASLAFVGIGLWMLWDYLILNDPLYFTNSPFSAKSQQQDWFERGELPAYKNLTLSFIYYMYTSFVNSGSVLSLAALGGAVVFLIKPSINKIILLTLLLVPVFFYTITLYAGQSIIFIPGLTPKEYEWNLFNVRYGVMMIPAAAFLTAYLLHYLTSLTVRLQHPTLGSGAKGLVTMGMAGLLIFQTYRFISKDEPVISLEDGISGLSASRGSDAETWIKQEYDGGYILVDDFARTLSIIRSGLPMDKVIYVGNKPYWEESFEKPEKYARWIIMQDGDSVWKNLYENEAMQGRVYAHFEKAYTSPQILIFKQTTGPSTALSQ
jgi:hypothetical protein